MNNGKRKGYFYKVDAHQIEILVTEEIKDTFCFIPGDVGPYLEPVPDDKIMPMIKRNIKRLQWISAGRPIKIIRTENAERREKTLCQC
jgi:hypothetical protein